MTQRIVSGEDKVEIMIERYLLHEVSDGMLFRVI